MNKKVKVTLPTEIAEAILVMAKEIEAQRNPSKNKSYHNIILNNSDKQYIQPDSYSAEDSAAFVGPMPQEEHEIVLPSSVEAQIKKDEIIELTITHTQPESVIDLNEKDNKEELTVEHKNAHFVGTVGKKEAIKEEEEAHNDDDNAESMDEVQENKELLANKINKQALKKVAKGAAYATVGALSLTGVLAISGFLLHVKPAKTIEEQQAKMVQQSAKSVAQNTPVVQAPAKTPEQIAQEQAQIAQQQVESNPVQSGGVITNPKLASVNAANQPLSENTPPPKPDDVASKTEAPKPSPILPDPRIEVVMGHAKDNAHKLYVFSDPACPYCKKLEPDLEKAALNGYEIHIFPTPVHAQSFDLIKSIACSGSNKKLSAWEQTIKTETKAGTIGCKGIDDVNDRSLRFFSQFGFNATPTLVNANGVVHVGGFNTYDNFVSFTTQQKGN